MLQAIGLWSVSSRNLYCCAVLASLLSRHKLSYCAHSPRQKKTPAMRGVFQRLIRQFFYLVEAQLHWRVATEDGHEHRELLGGGLNVGDDSCHGGERTVGDGDLIANGVGDFDLALLGGGGLSPAALSASEAIIGAIIATTSLRESGAGSLVGPTKPVTPSVSRTIRRAFSSGHIRIST